MIYTGIGSRETPFDFIQEIYKVSYILRDCTLRSGAAKGADEAFELNATKKEIFIPWNKFNKYVHNGDDVFALEFMDNKDEAERISKEYHPNWNRLSKGGISLMTRNVYQILGKDLKSPSDFLVCYTKDGKISGGTGQAMRIAKDYNVPIHNLKSDGEFKRIQI